MQSAAFCTTMYVQCFKMHYSSSSTFQRITCIFSIFSAFFLAICMVILLCILQMNSFYVLQSQFQIFKYLNNKKTTLFKSVKFNIIFSTTVIVCVLLQLKEQFTLTLLPYGNSSGVIGNFSSIAIEIEENDDPYGLVHFLLNPPIYYISKYNSYCR